MPNAHSYLKGVIISAEPKDPWIPQRLRLSTLICTNLIGVLHS